GAEIVAREIGQVVVAWGLDRTREGDAMTAAGIARRLIDEQGGAASLGLAEAVLLRDGAPVSAARPGNRALRPAAAAAPGSLAIEPRLAERLARAGRPAPGLVGRQPELAQALAAARAALAERRGVVLHLSGEAGIGKTRLAQEIARNLREDGVRTI